MNVHLRRALRGAKWTGLAVMFGALAILFVIQSLLMIQTWPATFWGYVAIFVLVASYFIGVVRDWIGD